MTYMQGLCVINVLVVALQIAAVVLTGVHVGQRKPCSRTFSALMRSAEALCWEWQGMMGGDQPWMIAVIDGCE